MMPPSDTCSPLIRNSQLAAAALSGLYIAAFYISENLTMLAIDSVLVLTVAFVLPIMLIVLAAEFLRARIASRVHYGLVTVFLCCAYLFFALRVAVFEVPAIREILQSSGFVGRNIFRVLYLVIPAAVFSAIFRNYLSKFSIVLSVLIIAVIAQNARVIVAHVLDGNSLFDNPDSAALQNVQMRETPNIYFILTDGFGSLTYMDENGIDVSDFTSSIRNTGFTLYSDTFSNYQPTTSAMIAMLNMQHHHYKLTQNISEVDSLGRRVIGGDNNLVKALRNNGYGINYVHQGAYLLLHGCKADSCFPDVPLAGAKTVINQVAPRFLRSSDQSWGHEQATVLPEVRTRVAGMAEIAAESAEPQFHYIHIFKPGHTGTSVENTCSESRQLAWYADQVEDSAQILVSLVEKIVAADPPSVVVLAGDHGPFVVQNCSRNADLNSVGEYRDRAGALIAIRWPDGYDGRFDGHIRTSVNMFRYILASLAPSNAEILDSVAEDDVFIHGESGILQVMDDGNFLEPAVKFENKR